MLEFGNKGEAFQYKIEEISLPSFLCKILMMFKSSALYLIDVLNLLYKYPLYTIKTNGSKELEELYTKLKENNLKLDSKKLYIYAGDENFPATGDQCLHNGLYAAHDISFNKSADFFNNYVNSFIDVNRNGELYLLRGTSEKSIRTDASGDQLTGFTLACSEYRKRYITLPNRVSNLVSTIVKNNYILKDDLNVSTQFGHFNPNPILINGAVPVILATLLVNNKITEFNYLYHNCGYKYMLSHADIYLWNPHDDFNVLGFKGERSWFSTHLAVLNLSMIYYWAKDDKIKNKVGKIIKKILNKNKWNTWIWAIALEYGVIDSICEEAIDYFKSFTVTEKDIDSKFYPLGGQGSDFIWQRSPFKKQDEWCSGRIDYVYTYDLLKKHQLI